MNLTNPSEGERFYLRMLLCHVKRPTSFRNLKTVEDVEYATFKDAAIARGLWENDREWEYCVEESSSVASPKQLRDLFATLLVFCHLGTSENYILSLYLNNLMTLDMKVYLMMLYFIELPNL